MAGSGGLPLRTKIGYGVGDVGGNLFFTIMGFWLLNFVTDTLGLAASLAGVALLIGRAWDAVTDPLMGALSDRTVSRWGRRRPYLLFGAAAVVAGMTLVFLDVGGRGWSQGALFVWVVFAFCLVNSAYTVVFVPYAALTPELARGFQERTNLNGYRMSWAIVGTLLGAGGFSVVVELAAGAGAGSGYTVAGALFGLVTALVVLITFASVRERPAAPERAPANRAPEGNALAGYAAALKVRPFRLALVAWTLFIAGTIVATSAVPFYFEHVYGRPELAAGGSLVLLLAAFAAIPGWVWLAGRIGKRTAYSAGMALFGAALLAAYLVAQRDLTTLFVVMGVAGVGLAANYVLPWSIIPDVVDYDELANGRRREGVLYGMWTFLQKLGLGLAALISGAVLQWTGYVPEAAQTPLALHGIRLLIGPVPALFFVAGILVLARYPIDRAAHAEIRARLEAASPRAAGSA